MDQESIKVETTGSIEKEPQSVQATVSINLVQLHKALDGGWQNKTISIPSMAANR